MPLPLIPMLISAATAAHSSTEKDQAQSAAATKDAETQHVLGARKNRQVAQQQIQQQGRTGFAGIDATSSAMAKQQSVFQNILAKYQRGGAQTI